MRKKSHRPPSKLKYDQDHPTISIRVTQDLYQELGELSQQNGRSLGEILREAIQKQVSSTAKEGPMGRVLVTGLKDAESTSKPALPNDVRKTEMASDGENEEVAGEVKKQSSTRANRREEIIRTAARLFAEKGYHGVSLDEVAENMNITKPALYQYIRNKEEILQEICQACLVTGFDHWKLVNKSELTPRDKLRLFIEGVVMGVAEGRDMMAVLFGDSNALSPEVRNEVRMQQKAHDKELEALLQEGIDAGQFKIADKKIAVFTIFGACMWIYQWYRQDSRLSPQSIADGIIKLLEGGYLREGK